MERIKLIEHEGKEIVFIDYRGLEGDDNIIEFIKEVSAYLIGLDRPTLQLTDVSGIQFSERVAAFLMEKGHEVVPYIKKDAVVGVSGVKRVAFHLYNFVVRGNAKAFEDEAAAKAWLVQ